MDDDDSARPGSRSAPAILRNRHSPMRRLALAACAFVGTLASVGCNTARGLIPSSGRVIDAVGKQPIAGAVVRFDRTAECFGGFESIDRYKLQPREGVTDGEGRFRIWATPFFVPCIFPGWAFELTIVAPGYRPTIVRDIGIYGSRKISGRAGTFGLNPLRTRLELQEYRHIARRLAGEERKGRLLEHTVEAILAAHTGVAGSPGAFAQVEGASFVRVAVAHSGVITENFPGKGPLTVSRETILAQDASGLLYAWFPSGDPVDGTPIQLGPGVKLVGGSRDYSRFATSDHFFFPRNGRATIFNHSTENWSPRATRLGEARKMVELGGWLFSIEGERKAIATYDLDELRKPGDHQPNGDGPILDVLPGSDGIIECATAQAPSAIRLVVFGRTSHGRALYCCSDSNLPEMALRAVSLETGALDGEVVDCASGANVTFVATRGKGLQRVKIAQSGGRNWHWGAHVSAPVTLESSGGPSTFLSIATGTGLQYGGALVYAVSGDNTVYRFSQDLEPDAELTIDETR
jgi:hypothetical protein